MYADCQSGYYLLDELYRDLINGRYGNMNIMTIEDIERSKTDTQMCVLRCEDGKHEDIIINKQVFVVGKKKEFVDYCLEEDGISRQHCKFKVNGWEVLIEDMNSTNGTLVNDIRIFPGQLMPLQQGDRIKLASVTYVVQS